MARINIDDTLYGDPRFEIIVRKIGIDLAVGQFVRIAKLAQKFWLDGKKPIPENLYKYGEFSEHFIETDFVQRVEGGLYLHGSEEQFSWIWAKRENGKKGGRPSKNNTLTKAKVNLAKANESYENPLTLTLTPTLTLKNNNVVLEVIKYFNKTTGKKFRATTSEIKKQINGRLTEGFNLDEFKSVIDIKNRQWRGDKNMDKHLNPTTIFRQSNFEKYLNEVDSGPEKRISQLLTNLGAEVSQ